MKTTSWCSTLVNLLPCQSLLHQLSAVLVGLALAAAAVLLLAGVQVLEALQSAWK
jgi:hypothetical protein